MPADEASPDPVSVRAFREADRVACQRLAAEAALSSYGPRLPQASALFTPETPLEPADVRAVAVLGEEVVGLIDLVGAHVSNLFVSPARQGRGVGAALMRWAETRIPGDVTLSVFQVNPDARRFYERLGYVVDGEKTVRFGGADAPVWRMRKARAAD